MVEQDCTFESLLVNGILFEQLMLWEETSASARGTFPCRKLTDRSQGRRNPHLTLHWRELFITPTFQWGKWRLTFSSTDRTGRPFRSC